METKEISENLYIDLDGKGNLVSMTIEHAKEKANISEVSYLQMDKIVAWHGAQARMKGSVLHNSIFYFPYLVIEIWRSAPLDSSLDSWKCLLKEIEVLKEKLVIEQWRFDPKLVVQPNPAC